MNNISFIHQVQEALYLKGYILVCLGGGITGDVQTNDTAMHKLLKGTYREKEQRTLTEKLIEKPVLERSQWRFPRWKGMKW